MFRQRRSIAETSHALCIQVYPRRYAKGYHIGCGISGAQCFSVWNGKGNSAETAICSLWHDIKPPQRTGVSQAWAASFRRGAAALGIGWASRTQGVDGHVSCFLPICGQEYSDRYLLYVLLAVGAGSSITSVQCIEPVTRGGKQIGRRLQTQKIRK